jgi:hypothetical protein
MAHDITNGTPVDVSAISKYIYGGIPPEKCFSGGYYRFGRVGETNVVSCTTHGAFGYP